MNENELSKYNRILKYVIKLYDIVLVHLSNLNQQRTSKPNKTFTISKLFDVLKLSN